MFPHACRKEDGGLVDEPRMAPDIVPPAVEESLGYWGEDAADFQPASRGAQAGQAFCDLDGSDQRYDDLFQYAPIPLLQVEAGRLTHRMTELKSRGVTSIRDYTRDNPGFLKFAMQNTVILHANREAITLFGGRRLKDLLGPVEPFWRNSEEAYLRHLENRFRFARSFREEATFITLDGRILEGMLTVTSSPASVQAGLTLNAFVDLTEKKRAERQLAQVQSNFAHAARVSAMGQLTASIVHEIAQPLAAIAITGEAGLRWLRRSPEPGKVQEALGRVVSDARRAADIVTRLRSMAIRRETELKVLSLDDIIREALLFLQHEFNSAQINVEHCPSEQDALAAVDRTQIQQVIVNLALNARQALSSSPPGTRKIRVTTTADATWVRCRVEDSGPGIPEQHVPQLFDTFFTMREDGMGIGLAVCRSIIEAHKGHIELMRESTLGGAGFAFQLPVSPTAKLRQRR